MADMLEKTMLAVSHQLAASLAHLSHVTYFSLNLNQLALPIENKGSR